MFFLVLVLVTFFSWGNSGMERVPTQGMKTGTFAFSSSGQTTEITDISSVQEWLLVEKITSIDTIYSSPWSTYTIEWDRINIWDWEFIINIKSIGTQYTIFNNSFDISSLEAGSVYINTKDERNYMLFSLDTLINVWFVDKGEDITYVDLYPHMYVKFNPNRLRFLKNADLVRISSVFTLWSFTWFMSTSNLESFFVNIWVTSSDFFDNYMNISKIRLEQNKDSLKEILSIKSWEFPWIKFLKKYYYLFLNDTKKKAYYKNTIFNDLTNLMNSKKKKAQIVQDIIDGLSLLENTPDDYNDIRDVIDYYYSLVSLDSDFAQLYAKINMHALMLSINGKELSDSQQSLLLMNTIYQDYNISGVYSYEKLSSFSWDYMSISWLKSDNMSLEQKQRFDYFSFFLSELFISRYVSTDENLKDFWSNDNFKSLLRVMGDYVAVSQNIYDSDDEKRSITGMYVHLDVLKKLQDFMRTALFKNVRWENGVLIKSRKFEIDSIETNLLSENINTLLAFYNSNKKFLSIESQNDSALINSYNLLQSQFKEYFLALSDYENYLYNYDETKKSLFWIETLWQGSDNIVFSEWKALEYLRQFSQASLSDINITLREDFYEVENFIVDWTNFSFSLYPYEANRIDDIIKNNEPIAVSYKLDSVEFDWNERSQSARDEEEENTYDFSRFFLNTFADPVVDNAQELFELDRNVNVNNDKFIVVFKRDKLLGATWEFSSIQSFLDIEFSDIDVVQNQNLYDIFINDASLEMSHQNGWISANFNSDYVLAADKHYFKNIRLSPYISNLWIQKPEIGDNFIQIVGNINLVDLKSEMLLFTSNYDKVKYIYKSISQNLWVSDIGIRYLKSSQKLNFRFDYQWDFISILLSGDTIENISQGWEILLRDANYRTIDDILTTIKK